MILPNLHKFNQEVYSDHSTSSCLHLLGDNEKKRRSLKKLLKRGENNNSAPTNEVVVEPDMDSDPGTSKLILL
jgi:uncharacterized membrane-anchored protein YhcB (DUF1043 family)